jgi:hypothetical protein
MRPEAGQHRNASWLATVEVENLLIYKTIKGTPFLPVYSSTKSFFEQLAQNTWFEPAN